MSKRVLILGAGGFIGGHLACKLKKQGCWVRGVDIKKPEFRNLNIDEFDLVDLRDNYFVRSVIDYDIDEVYQLAADMGGAGYVFTGKNDADIVYNSFMINLNVVREAVRKRVKKVFFSSSACVYPESIQVSTNYVSLKEYYAYPANPDSDYGWEKLISERLYSAFNRNYNLDIRIARFHNIFGPYGTYDGGKEKAPAALCRKIAESNNKIDMWGDGEQVRSFLYIDECLEGIEKLMKSDYKYPINIGSDEAISINNLAKMIIDISGKDIKINHIKGPEGVRNRNSNNELIEEVLSWRTTQPLKIGIEKTYNWIKEQI